MEGHKELVEKLNALVQSLENGELTLEELTAMEEVTRKLHERSVILKYKAFESVVGTTVKTAETSEETPVALAPSQAEEPKVLETVIEEEESSFDFAIFDEPETTEEKEASTEIEIEVEASNEASEIEEEVIVEAEETVEKEVMPMTENEPEEVVNESPASPGSGSSFLDKFSQQDNSLAGQFSSRPLDSLIGAFGLNERLRFINDLFDGSSEKFSDAIKALDAQSGLDEARQKAAGYAEENSWDPEEEVVAEFMNYLNRRYA